MSLDFRDAPIKAEWLRIIVIFFFCCSASSQGQDRAPEIGAFGEFGELTPTFLGSRPNPSFFSSPMTKSFAVRSDYTASFDLNALKRNLQAGSEAEDDLELTLLNQNGAACTIVVSAMREADNLVVNYLVGVSSGQSRTVRINKLLTMDTLFFVSIQDFSGYLASSKDKSQTTYELNIAIPEPSATAEIRTETPANICRDKTVIMRVRHPSGPYEDAWFKRTEVTNAVTHCSPGVNPIKEFEINVFWPSQDILHHCSNLQSIICSEAGCTPGINCTPPCQMSGYSTDSLVNGNELLWRHIGDGGDPSPLFSFDNVLFNSDCGIVFCREIGAGGECLENPNLFWYVYQPGAPPCP